MAATQAGRDLTEQHRRTQLALRAVTLRDLLRIWPAFDPADVDRTWAAVRAALVTLIQARHRDSAALAATYYQAFRLAEGNTGTMVPRLADVPEVERLTVSLDATGRAQAPKGSSALTAAAGAVTRHVLNGGRATIVEAVESDPMALGYARVTDGNPCAFCAMVASRGPVYAEDTVEFHAHDHCGCTAEPVYRRDQPWPGRAREFRQLWNETTVGERGKDKLNAFRRAYERGREVS